ncbi:hypothetical protein [Oceanobacillus polygoni]|uniref:Uncharacterized protein n=1 Tax=Oceanobacillus polygoni TaxID=1235259 RepID=A0A9X1CBD0_9BACI|nr:hypothetical protein [Oceanobacillus polygoni]MBP2076826.1 hypothetical protein [Oceanobacillus polygoni]
MFIELLSELLNEFSPIYFYIGLLLSIIPIRIYNHPNTYQTDMYIRRSHALQFQLLSVPELTATVLDIRSWITNKTKRIEIPDDNEEDSFSLGFYRYKNRGGQKWNQLLYSSNLRNIALSYLDFYRSYYLQAVKAQPSR